MSSSLVIASAHVVVLINGLLYGQVSGFKWGSSTPRKEIYGIDSVEPYELAPTVTHLQGQLSLYRLIGDGGLEGKGIATHYADLPAEKYFRLQLVERRSDTILFQAESCCVESQEWNATARGQMTGTMSFRGLRWENEATKV